VPLSEFPHASTDATNDRGDEPPAMRVAPPGPMSRSALARLEKVECPAFGHRRSARAEQSGAEMLPIVLASGKGSNLFDVDGNRYVDLCAGFGALVLGHGPTPVLRAVEGQAERLVQALGDVYAADAKIALLERLAGLHPGVRPRVLLGQSGSDAVTAALKTARLATGKPGVVAFEGAYHGLGYGPLAACGVRPSYRLPFVDQLNAHVTFAPYPGAEADLDQALAAVDRALRGGDVGAVLVEPILGRGGCVVPPPAFLPGVIEAAHRHGALVIADEIWTGMGRSGALVRTTQVGAPADILCFGKGLGGGLAISACVAPEDIMMAWAGRNGGDPHTPGPAGDTSGEGVVHTSTHAGSPLACAAAIATLDALRFHKLPERARSVGDAAREAFGAALEGVPGVIEVRGAGLMIGIELDGGDRGLRAMRGMLAQGYVVITGGTRSETLTLTPPLTVLEERLAEAAVALRDVLLAT
jgi:4-aminobutyrate aminotransferase/(S)-3-amino-2-methylpropionate transaminase